MQNLGGKNVYVILQHLFQENMYQISSESPEFIEDVT